MRYAILIGVILLILLFALIQYEYGRDETPVSTPPDPITEPTVAEPVSEPVDEPTLPEPETTPEERTKARPPTQNLPETGD